MERVRRKTGMVFREGALFDSLSVYDNVAYRLHEQNVPEEEIEREGRLLLRFVDFEDAIDKQPDELSGGVQKRASIARALAGHPEIVLLDEPTAALDPPTAAKICQLVIKLRDLEDVTSVLVTHEMENVKYLTPEYAAVSETNKVASVWREFSPDELSFRPHPRSGTVQDIFKHQLLSERRFFGEFLGLPEPPAEEVLPQGETPADYAERLARLASLRLSFIASRNEVWWLEVTPFFDVERTRIWIFWRRLLHTAHHRTQLTVCLRLFGKSVPRLTGRPPA